MPKKRSPAPPAPPTDEWGIYDPAKAGMQALFSRLGRPTSAGTGGRGSRAACTGRRTARAKAARSTKRKTPPAIAAVEPTTAPTVAVPVQVPSSKAMNAPAPRRVGKPARPRPAVPPPSPRRPRGPVPLAAWAHAVHDTRRDEPKRGEAKGLWRGIFRIPSEVALMEYGRGCRIHRVVIETAADRLPESF